MLNNVRLGKWIAKKLMNSMEPKKKRKDKTKKKNQKKHMIKVFGKTRIFFAWIFGNWILFSWNSREYK